MLTKRKRSSLAPAEERVNVSFQIGKKSVTLYLTTSYDVVGPTLDYYGQEMESPLKPFRVSGAPLEQPYPITQPRMAKGSFTIFSLGVTAV